MVESDEIKSQMLRNELIFRQVFLNLHQHDHEKFLKESLLLRKAYGFRLVDKGKIIGTLICFSS
jgi:hypothetical protein